MELLPDRSYVQAPGVCHLCDRSPDEGQPVVDTKMNRTVGIPVYDGRIYVCMGCANAIAQVIGFVSVDAQNAAIADAKIAQHEAEVIKARAVALFQEFNAPVPEVPEPVVDESGAAFDPETGIEVKEPVVEDEEPEDEPAEDDEA